MRRWIKSEVRSMIVDAVAPIISGKGFRFKKTSEAFVRKIEGGRQELGVSLVDYNPIFQFSFTLCSRLEAVQEITNRFSGALPQYHSMTLTSITQLEFLGLTARQGRVNFEVSSEAELVALMPGVITLVGERVLPFFEEYHDIAAVNRGLNPEGAERVFRIEGLPDRRAFDATNQPYRSMTGITTAFLANDPRLDALIDAYRSQINEMGEQDRSKCERLLDFLNGERHLASRYT